MHSTECSIAIAERHAALAQWSRGTPRFTRASCESDPTISSSTHNASSDAKRSSGWLNLRREPDETISHPPRAPRVSRDALACRWLALIRSSIAAATRLLLDPFAVQSFLAFHRRSPLGVAPLPGATTTSSSVPVKSWTDAKQPAFGATLACLRGEVSCPQMAASRARFAPFVVEPCAAPSPGKHFSGPLGDPRSRSLATPSPKSPSSALLHSPEGGARSASVTTHASGACHIRCSSARTRSCCAICVRFALLVRTGAAAGPGKGGSRDPKPSDGGATFCCDFMQRVGLAAETGAMQGESGP